LYASGLGNNCHSIIIFIGWQKNPNFNIKGKDQAGNVECKEDFNPLPAKIYLTLPSCSRNLHHIFDLQVIILYINQTPIK
jgi:hypothetical protein